MGCTPLASHEYHQQIAQAHRRGVDKDGFVYDDRHEIQELVLRILRKMPPYTAPDVKKIRIGGKGDGGYVMLDHFEGVEAAYSFGIGGDVSWDKEIVRRGIDVFQYDHTIDFVPENDERFHWFKIGIAGRKTDECDTLPNLIASNGHAQCKNLILKCDIEGAEWDMLNKVHPDDLAPFRQIVLEMHDWGNIVEPAIGATVERAISNLTMRHSLIHVHANNNRGYAILGAVPVPAVLELSFVRSGDYRLQPSIETFPTRLDAPCTNARADYHLGTFRY